MALKNGLTLNHGWWKPDHQLPETGDEAWQRALRDLSKPLYCVQADGRLAVSQDGTAFLGPADVSDPLPYPLAGWAPAFSLTELGDKGFKADHGLKLAYICGAMANGITSTAMVEAAGKAGMIGFFGAGGLSIDQVEAAIHTLQNRRDPIPYGFNLIHSPNDMALEQRVVDLYINRGVHLVSASAYMDITLPLAAYRVHGIHRGHDGQIVCPNRIIAKISREEVARKFFSPPPEKFLKILVEQGNITTHQAELARQIPMAQDMTAEADSGGHTDNRPALCLFPTLLAIRDEMADKFGYGMLLRVGIAGGIATPESAAAAFAMGAAWILTGSVNQSCVEADTSPQVKKMLADARQADITMAPAADMFEMGVKVQVLKRGTLFSLRGAKLYEIYRNYDRFSDVPENQRKVVEETVLKCGFEEEWENTRNFFMHRDPSQVERAEKDPKHKMALVFRSYLGQAAIWAKKGLPDRVIDYQIWCGPAMGAFNEWVRGSYLEAPQNRTVVGVGLNLLHGAAVMGRLNTLRHQGAQIPEFPNLLAPVPEDEIRRLVPAI
ncbi:PfaD family polyunsaturated fatty acid/polyketide biosynthesis protein [Desulfosarcina sp. OttesenSCG-928-A07]|nr:PfaD family polyunsaturated fatty acid/polyketide biosynthesis protein [Desulfosarcina sp. OttesenSCG-928-G17]MDL2329289.1 PfaD family polyunsaturated fatty acid/polyketide biosynthesis protein [Desulfosarcina sp. OttesenSCG-928-A07]